MRKQFISLLLLLCLVIPFFSPVQASGPRIPPRIVVTLQNLETGETVHLPAKVTEQLIGSYQQTGSYEQSVGPKQMLVTYVVEIPASLLASGIKKDERYDSTMSVYGYLHMYYQYYYQGLDYYVAVDKYMAKWVPKVSGVSMSGAYIMSGCSGDFADGYRCPGPSKKTIGAPSGNTWYTHSSFSWKGKYMKIGGERWLAGQSYVKLTRGGSSWGFNMCVAQGEGC